MFTGITGAIVLGGNYYSSIIDVFVNIPIWATTIYGGMIFAVLFFFGFYHWSLIIKGKTTNEEVRGKYTLWKGNPFNQGTKQNCINNFRKY
jgi:hypothetical protein